MPFTLRILHDGTHKVRKNPKIPDSGGLDIFVSANSDE